MKRFFLSAGLQLFAVVLTVGLLFSAFFFYAYANDRAGIGEIFSYGDYRNTDAYHEILTGATEEIVYFVRNVYAGTAVTASDFEESSMNHVFHYYFYANGRVLTDLPELEGIDYTHARSLAVDAYGVCYFLNTVRTQNDWFSVNGEYDWHNLDLTQGAALSVFTCDAGAILVPDSVWLSQQFSVWQKAKDRALAFLILCCSALVPILYLIVVAGWKEALPGVPKKSHIFTELLFLSALFSFFGILQAIPVSFLNGIHASLALFGYGAEESVYTIFSLTVTFFCIVILFCFRSLIARTKSGSVIRDSFLFWFISKPLMQLRRKIENRYFSRYRYSVQQLLKLLLFLIPELLLLTFFVVAQANHYWIVLRILLLVATLVTAAWFCYSTYRDARSLNRLLDHITALQSGNLSFQAPIPDNDPFSDYEGELRRIGEEFDLTLKNQVAAERSKVNLITNVSHDLRTPLTSIIGCVDLLAKSDLSPEAQDYVRVIAQKSDRLNRLVEDVFELSKASSGGERILMEDLDLFVLTRQLISDLSDFPNAEERQVRLQENAHSAPVRSNGAKLYRILQNMLGNALKYSLEGTRVYVVLSVSEGIATVSVKNISSYEMNFSAEQISEQFVRGDPSRTGEGSGLGLAIAKSFAEQLGAEFRIQVDGDQFRSELSLPLRTENLH